MSSSQGAHKFMGIKGMNADNDAFNDIKKQHTGEKSSILTPQHLSILGVPERTSPIQFQMLLTFEVEMTNKEGSDAINKYVF